MVTLDAFSDEVGWTEIYEDDKYIFLDFLTSERDFMSNRHFHSSKRQFAEKHIHYNHSSRAVRRLFTTWLHIVRKHVCETQWYRVVWIQKYLQTSCKRCAQTMFLNCSLASKRLNECSNVLAYRMDFQWQMTRLMQYVNSRGVIELERKINRLLFRIHRYSSISKEADN